MARPSGALRRYDSVVCWRLWYVDTIVNIAKRSHLVCRVMCMHIVCLFDGCCTCVFIHICKQFIFVNNS